MGNTLTPEQTDALIQALGPTTKPDIVKQNGRVYQVQPDGSALEVQGIPVADPKTDSSPTTIHVTGKGWMQYDPASNSWGVIPGSQEAADAPKTSTFQGSDGRQYAMKSDANGNPFAQVLGGDNPAVEKPASKTADQIAAESGANVVQSSAAADASAAQAARLRKETATMQTPEQQQSDRMAQIRATAQAQADAALQIAKDKVASGIELTEQDKLELQNKLAGTLAQMQADLTEAGKQADYTREQPQRDTVNAQSQQRIGIEQQNATTNAAQIENNRINQERQAQFERDKGQADVLNQQGQQGQAMLDRVVKAGVAPSMSSLKAAMNPLQLAFQIMQGQVQNGSIPSSAVPTPMAPRPAGAPDSNLSVPAPAAAAPAPSAPAPATVPAPAPFAQSDLPEGRGMN